MKRNLIYLGVVFVLGVTGMFLLAARLVHKSFTPPQVVYRNEWSPAAAARYLDAREVWWQYWPSAQRDHGTMCVSCHTVVPYALVRPALRRQLGQMDRTATEQKMLDSIETRVANWPQTSSWYGGPAYAGPSRATESVLNVLILSAYDAADGQQLSPATRSAFDDAWALQSTSGNNAGGWDWQNFHEAPWESNESAYQGAAMMAIAVGMTPESYRVTPAVQEHLTQLDAYLQQKYPAQPLLNQLYVLWASASTPDLLTDSERHQLIAMVTSLQQPDGGWSLSSLDRQTALKPAFLDFFKRADRVDGSDGCATGLVLLGLEKAGVDPHDAVFHRGFAWLTQHQHQDGSWWATSLNGLRDPKSDMGHFMSDAATGYAVLALEQARTQQSETSAVQNGKIARVRAAGSLGKKGHNDSADTPLSN